MIGASLDYRLIAIDQINLIRPLWEQLNALHAEMSSHFSADLNRRTFDERRLDFVDRVRSGALRIDVAAETIEADPIGFCISSLSETKRGEIDSMFVADAFRNCGVGSMLMRRALEWLDRSGAVAKTLVALYENEAAIRFYRRFGFSPRTVTLVQTRT